MNALFSRNKPWKLAADVPDAAVIGLGLVYFIILEWLICQGGAAWQRLRGGEALFGGRWGLGLRLAVGAGLAYAVGGVPLLVIALLLTLQSLLSAAPIGGNAPGGAELAGISGWRRADLPGRDAALAGRAVAFHRAGGAGAGGVLPGAGVRCRRTEAASSPRPRGPRRMKPSRRTGPAACLLFTHAH